MATVIRAKISEKNKYWIDKHRHYELKHFCLQYPEWKRSYEACGKSTIFTSRFDDVISDGSPSDLTAKYAIRQAEYRSKIEMVERLAIEADPALSPYILKAVTEGLSYPHLKTKMNIPCGKDMYYDRYRRFFWLLNQERG